jgi:hypothetical protein
MERRPIDKAPPGSLRRRIQRKNHRKPEFAGVLIFTTYHCETFYGVFALGANTPGAVREKSR